MVTAQLKPTLLPSGILVLESEKKEPEPQKKIREYRCKHCSDIGCVVRMIEAIKENRAELVSVVRHGSAGRCISSEARGYVITYLHHEVIGTWEYT